MTSDGMTDIRIRRATPGEWETAGGLRWDSVTELGGTAVDARELFSAQFAEWARTHQDLHGGRLMAAIVERARELGLERVTVHSSPRAVPAYERNGFASEDRLLHAYVVYPEAQRDAGR